MQITLSKKEYERLVQLFIVGNYVLTAYDQHPGDDKNALLDLEQRLFSYAAAAGMEKTVYWDDELKTYVPEYSYEDGVLARYIDPYNNDVFWNELSERLAERDLRDELGDDGFSSLAPDIREEKIQNRADRYFTEFTSKGIDGLRIRPHLKVLK